MKRIVLLFMLLIPFMGISQEIDLEAVVSEISEAIELDETQTKALESELTKYTISLQLIFDKYEQAEPDPQAMLTEIKHAQAEYNKALKGQIGKEKFKQYEQFVEKVKLEILGEAAGLRLLDLQDPLMMTDEQVLQMKPVLAKAMLGMMQALMKYVDAPMTIRTKLKASNELKAIKKTFDRETAAILTQQQIQKWEAMKEEAKKQQEAEQQQQGAGN